MQGVHFSMPAASVAGIIIPFSDILSLGDLNKVQESNRPSQGGVYILGTFSLIVQSSISSSKNSLLPFPVSWKKLDFFFMVKIKRLIYFIHYIDAYDVSLCVVG